MLTYIKMLPPFHFGLFLIIIFKFNLYILNISGERDLMKKIVIIQLLILIPIIFSFFSGCEELDQMIESSTKPNYINVVVTADATVLYKFIFYAKDGSTASTQMNVTDTNVRFDMIKAGGETHTLYRVTDASGKTQTATASFKLYNEQPIECIATAEGVDKELYSSSTKTLSWNQVNSSKDFGETYTWVVHHDIIGLREQYEP